jgi:hypothetical protein
MPLCLSWRKIHVFLLHLDLHGNQYPLFVVIDLGFKSLINLTYVMNTYSNTLHGEDHGILQAWSKLCSWIQCHQLRSSLRRPGRFKL